MNPPSPLSPADPYTLEPDPAELLEQTRDLEDQDHPFYDSYYDSSIMSHYLKIAAHAAKEAGWLLKEQFGGAKTVNTMLSYDIKLQLDEDCQEMITKALLEAFPHHAVLGEEGTTGDQDSPFIWIVDPIDGTVNYYYGIPHFCVSIALRQHGIITHGVIYDPMQDELWAVEKYGVPLLNGQPIAVSPRDKLSEAILTCGFAKTADSMEANLQRNIRLTSQVRKTRMMGSAALAMAYVATGRLDAYLEEQISIWDVAAGLLLVECAGGIAELKPIEGKKEVYSIIASNGHLQEALRTI